MVQNFEPDTAFGWNAADGSSLPGTVTAKAVPAFIFACALGKLLAAWLCGFTSDEAYTTVISRTLALSYYDHPPLHQWMVHGTAAVAGEGWWLRLPAFIMAAAINVPLYGLARRLFGTDAALWTLFAFNATPYFLAWPDGLIIPDPPLFFFLAAAIWAVAEILFGPPRSKMAVWTLWLAAGAAFGFAGLSKYSAIFAPVSLFCYLVGSPRYRGWLFRPEPYAGAVLALAIFSPVIIWNYENQWISFAFQSGRVGEGLSFEYRVIRAFFEALAAQIPLLSPWIGLPLLVALTDAARFRRKGNRERFLAWLVLVPIIFFVLMPFLGKKTIPHWFNSGWLFAFPLLGRWLAAQPRDWLRRWAPWSAALSGAMFAAYAAYILAGPFWGDLHAYVRLRDPTAWSYNWQGLTGAAAWNDPVAQRPGFLAVTSWRVGGKAGLSLGREVPVCAFTRDPREFAFLCAAPDWVGKDGLIVLPKEDLEGQLPWVAPYFERIGPREDIAIGRAGKTERVITVMRGYGLKGPYPLPYGSSAVPQ